MPLVVSHPLDRTAPAPSPTVALNRVCTRPRVPPPTHAKGVQLIWWNAHGLERDAVQWRKYLRDSGTLFCGVSETWLWGQDMSDADYAWFHGPERPPHERTSRVSGGIGAFVHRSLEAVVARSGAHSFWVRIAMRKRKRPLFVYGVCTPTQRSRCTSSDVV